MFWLKQFFPDFHLGWAIVWVVLVAVVGGVLVDHRVAASIGLTFYLAQSTGSRRRFILITIIGAAMVWLFFFHTFTFYKGG